MRDPLARFDAPFYALLRLVAGLLFMQHGAQKILGLLGGFGGSGRTAPLFSLLWFAGVIELGAGALVAIGLFTSPAAFLASGAMAAAYFIGHAGRGPWPVLNQGELAALFAFVFLYISARGPGTLSLDAMRGRGRGRGSRRR